MNKEEYKLNHSVTEKQLHNFGFRNNTYKTNIYKDIIQLVVKVDMDCNWWNYMVICADTNELYPAYYDRKYGKNNIVSEIEPKISNVIKQMEAKHILYRKRKKGK